MLLRGGGGACVGKCPECCTQCTLTIKFTELYDGGAGAHNVTGLGGYASGVCEHCSK